MPGAEAQSTNGAIIDATSHPHSEMTTREAIRLAIREEMRVDSNVFMMGEDIGVYGGAFAVSDGLLTEFGPRRIRDTPISEEAVVGAAVGAAMLGMRPIVEVQFFDFITDAMDQIVNQAAKTRFMLGGDVSVPLVVRGPAGSGTGAAAQHSQSLENWFVHVPGLKVVMPSSPADARGLLKSSIRDDNPVIFVEHKLLYNLKGPIDTEVDGAVPLGQAAIKRAGSDVTVVATGIMVQRALAAADRAAEQNVDVEVIDPRTLKPLDEETIVRSVSRTGRLIVVHEAVRTGGFGGEVVAVVAASDAFDYLDAPILRLGCRDVPIPYNRTLETQVVPSQEDILRAIVDLVSHRR